MSLKEMTFWIEDEGNQIIIGSRTTSENRVQIAACEGKTVIIGTDCMLSHDIFIRTTDSHSITDMDGVRINQAENINIGDHVWIGMQSLILKGADIPNGCVIGARSLVTKNKFEANAVLVGSPAKMVKHQVKWTRRR